MMYSPPTYKRSQPHALYRVFTADDKLLYVGCTLSPLTRVTAHMKGKPWRKLITRVEIEWHENWDAARAAESTAIQDENPIWNVHHKPCERIRAIGIFHQDYREDDPSTWIVRVSA